MPYLLLDDHLEDSLEGRLEPRPFDTCDPTPSVRLNGQLAVEHPVKRGIPCGNTQVHGRDKPPEQP